MATSPLRADSLQLLAQTPCPIPASSNGIWIDSGTPNVLKFRKTDGSDTSLGAGGGGSTLPGAYSAGGAGPQNIALDSTRLGIQISDANAAISGALLDITDFAGSAHYFRVFPASLPSHIDHSIKIIPISDNATDLGSTSNRYANIYVGSLGFNGSTISLAESMTQAAGKTLAAASGSGAFDWHLATGAFQTSTGANSINGLTTIAPPAQSSGTTAGLLFTGAANTGLTASTNIPDIDYNLARSVQFATGAKTLQTPFRIQAPTYTAVGSTTITDSYTLYVTGAPTASTNITQTRSGDIYLGGGGIGSATGFTMISALADGAGSKALTLNTTTAWSTNAARLLSIQTNSVEKNAVGFYSSWGQWVYFCKASAGVIEDTGNTGFRATGSAAADIWVGASLRMTFSTTTMTSTLGRIEHVTTVSSTPYTVLSSDYLLAVDCSTAKTLNLPAAVAGTVYVVVDSTNQAATNNITVAPNGTDTINGTNASFVVNTNSGRATLYCHAANKWTKA